jgi:hypothetical protein
VSERAQRRALRQKKYLDHEREAAEEDDDDASLSEDENDDDDDSDALMDFNKCSRQKTHTRGRPPRGGGGGGGGGGGKKPEGAAVVVVDVAKADLRDTTTLASNWREISDDGSFLLSEEEASRCNVVDTTHLTCAFCNKPGGPDAPLPGKEMGPVGYP